MAIGFDTVSESFVEAGFNNTTTSHTVTGSNTIFFGGIWNGNTSGLTTVTYNGSSMTLVNSINGNPGGTTYMYYIVNPTTGTNTFSVTRSSTVGRLFIFGASYTGAAQTGQVDSSNTATNTGSSGHTVSTTVVAPNCWLVGVMIMDGANSLAAGSGTTMREKDTRFGQAGWFDSNGTVGTGSQGLSTTAIGANAYGDVVASFLPVATQNTGAFFRMMSA